MAGETLPVEVRPTIQDTLIKLQGHYKAGEGLDTLGFLRDVYQIKQLGYSEVPQMDNLLKTLGRSRQEIIGRSVLGVLQGGHRNADIVGMRQNIQVLEMLGLNNLPQVSNLIGILNKAHNLEEPSVPTETVRQVRKSSKRSVFSRRRVLAGGAAALGFGVLVAPSIPGAIASLSTPKETAIARTPEISAVTVTKSPEVRPTIPPPTSQPELVTPVPVTATPRPATPRPATPELTPTLTIKANALGRFTNLIPEIYDSKTKKPLSKEEIISRFGPGYNVLVTGYSDDDKDRFSFYDPNQRKYYDVNIDHVRFPENQGLPETEVPKITWLGIRNNVPSLMEFVLPMGATRVRIVSDNNYLSISTERKTTPPTPEEIKLNKVIEDSLEQAKRLGLKVLYTYNPSYLPTQEQIRSHLKVVLSKTPVDLEIGNEPDETTNGYWEDYNKTGSLLSFSKFVRLTIEEAKKIKPDIKIIIGALADPARNQAILVKNLKDAGVDLNGVEWAIHAYSPDELKNRFDIAQKATSKRDFVITELGFNGDEDDVLPKMISQARQLTNQEIYIHELPAGDANWGLVDPYTSRRSPRYYHLQKMAINIGKNQVRANT